MQGLADGYFIAPYTMSDYLASNSLPPLKGTEQQFADVEKESQDLTSKLLAIQGKRTVDDFHKALGRIMWDNVGMGRNEAGLTKAIGAIQGLREEFWKDVRVVGTGSSMNLDLERASRVADFLELGELMARDALHRKESCGGHFREEYQTEEGEAKRNDDKFAYVGAWEYKGPGAEETLNKEPLTFEYVKPSQRSYK